MRKGVLTAVLATALLTGCGGGGGGGGSSPAYPELDGTYQMTGFTARSSSGITITERDFSSWSGTVDMGPTRMYIHINIMGSVTDAEGAYEAHWDTPTSGVIYESGSPSFDFTLSNGRLTFILEDVRTSTGETFDVWYYFQKTSDSHFSRNAEKESQDNVTSFGSIFELLKSVIPNN